MVKVHRTRCKQPWLCTYADMFNLVYLPKMLIGSNQACCWNCLCLSHNGICPHIVFPLTICCSFMPSLSGERPSSQYNNSSYWARRPNEPCMNVSSLTLFPITDSFERDPVAKYRLQCVPANRMWRKKTSNILRSLNPKWKERSGGPYKMHAFSYFSPTW